MLAIPSVAMSRWLNSKGISQSCCWLCNKVAICIHKTYQRRNRHTQAGQRTYAVKIVGARSGTGNHYISALENGGRARWGVCGRVRWTRGEERAIKEHVCSRVLSYNACMKGLFQILSRSILGAYSIGWYGAKDIVLGKA